MSQRVIDVCFSMVRVDRGRIAYGARRSVDSPYFAATDRGGGYDGRRSSASALPARPVNSTRCTALANLDITPSVANFREAARHLWNAHYRQHLSDRDPWDVRDSFDEVSTRLFASLVLEPLGIDGTGLAPSNAREPVPVAGLIVRPSPESGVPIMINRDRPRSGYWDHPKQRIVGDEAELLLARFFDFDQLGYRDFRYLEVFVASSDREPEIVGRWALLDSEYARVFVGQVAPV